MACILVHPSARLVSCQVRWRIQRISLVCRGRILRSDPSCVLCLRAMQMTARYELESLRPYNLRCGQTLAGELLGYPTLTELRQIPLYLQVWGYLLRCVICIHSHRGCSASQLCSQHFTRVYVWCFFFLAQILLSWTRWRKFQPRNKKQQGILWFKYTASTHGLRYSFHVEQDMLTRRRPLLEGYAHALRPLPELSVWVSRSYMTQDLRDPESARTKTWYNNFFQKRLLVPFPRNMAEGSWPAETWHTCCRSFRIRLVVVAIIQHKTDNIHIIYGLTVLEQCSWDAVLLAGTLGWH